MADVPPSPSPQVKHYYTDEIMYIEQDPVNTYHDIMIHASKLLGENTGHFKYLLSIIYLNDVKKDYAELTLNEYVGDLMREKSKDANFMNCKQEIKNCHDDLLFKGNDAACGNAKVVCEPILPFPTLDDELKPFCDTPPVSDGSKDPNCKKINKYISLIEYPDYIKKSNILYTRGEVMKDGRDKLYISPDISDLYGEKYIFNKLMPLMRHNESKNKYELMLPRTLKDNNVKNNNIKMFINHIYGAPIFFIFEKRLKLSI